MQQGKTRTVFEGHAHRKQNDQYAVGASKKGILEWGSFNGEGPGRPFT